MTELHGVLANPVCVSGTSVNNTSRFRSDNCVITVTYFEYHTPLLQKKPRKPSRGFHIQNYYVMKYR